MSVMFLAVKRASISSARPAGAVAKRSQEVTKEADWLRNVACVP